MKKRTKRRWSCIVLVACALLLATAHANQPVPRPHLRDGTKPVVAAVMMALLASSCTVLQERPGTAPERHGPPPETTAPELPQGQQQLPLHTPQGLLLINRPRPVAASELSNEQRQQRQSPGPLIEHKRVNGLLVPDRDLSLGEERLRAKRPVPFEYALALRRGSSDSEIVAMLRHGLPLQPQDAMKMNMGDVITLLTDASGGQATHFVMQRRDREVFLRQVWTEDRPSGEIDFRQALSPTPSMASLVETLQDMGAQNDWSHTEPGLGKRHVQRWTSQLLDLSGKVLDERRVRSSAWLPQATARLGMGERLKQLARNGHVDVATLTFADGSEFHYIVGELVREQQSWLAHMLGRKPKRLQVEMNGWRGPNDEKTSFRVNLRFGYPNGRTSEGDIEQARRLFEAYGASRRKAPWWLVEQLRGERTSVDFIGWLGEGLQRLAGPPVVDQLPTVEPPGARELLQGVAAAHDRQAPGEVVAALYAGLRDVKQLDPDVLAAIGQHGAGTIVGGIIGADDGSRRVLFVHDLNGSELERVVPRVLDMMQFRDNPSQRTN